MDASSSSWEEAFRETPIDAILYSRTLMWFTGGDR